MIQKQPPPLDERVAQLEQDVRLLKSRLPPQGNDNELGWLTTIIGSLPDDELTREAQRLGREWRQAQTDGPNEP
ncbi:hypothetical protein LF1_44440 [Rubripirellula obstinata]|uniref:Uncharacterized protein n=1 Tax=Rubripirellula obstinata TaxID=406547 RepID=A0A5B1CR78_9BACT|nr:hypothetical protein LF1_44440 [Rubripirellula obstinata]